MQTMTAALRTPPLAAPGGTGALVACSDCDALQVAPAGPERAACFRCGAHLGAGGPDRLEQALPLTLAAIPLFIAANCLPLMSLDERGARSAATVVGAARALWGQHLPLVAVLVVATTVLLPGLQLATGLHLLLGLHRRQVPSRAALVFAVHQAVRPWTQIEILLLGLLVAYGKLTTVFAMGVGLGLPCLILLLLLEKAIAAALDPVHFWASVGALQAGRGRP
jgi:paraquat-inducible protein A